MEPDDAKSMKEEKTDNAIATIDDDVSGGVPVKVEKKNEVLWHFSKKCHCADHLSDDFDMFKVTLMLRPDCCLTNKRLFVGYV